LARIESLLVSYLKLVLAKLVGSLRELKESVCLSISPEESYKISAFEGYGLFTTTNATILED
jgi:hypothetical protein